MGINLKHPSKTTPDVSVIQRNWNCLAFHGPTSIIHLTNNQNRQMQVPKMFKLWRLCFRTCKCWSGSFWNYPGCHSTEMFSIVMLKHYLVHGSHLEHRIFAGTKWLSRYQVQASRFMAQVIVLVIDNAIISNNWKIGEWKLEKSV